SQQHQDPKDRDSCHVKHATDSVRQKVAQYMTAVERRQGNQVENAEQHVDEDSFVQNRCEGRDQSACIERSAGNDVVDNAVACNRRLRDNSQQHKATHSDDEVTDGAYEGSKNVIAHQMFEVSSVNRCRLCPSEQRSSRDRGDQRQQNRSKKVNVFERI